MIWERICGCEWRLRFFFDEVDVLGVGGCSAVVSVVGAWSFGVESSVVIFIALRFGVLGSFTS